MKQAINRILTYLLIFVSITVVFNATPAPLHPSNDLINKLAYYGAYYGVGFLFWGSVYELTYRIFKRFRRKTQLPTENQPTSQLQDVPETHPLHKH